MEAAATETDIVNAYRFILGRLPSDAEVSAWHARGLPLPELRQKFLQSKEFVERRQIGVSHMAPPSIEAGLLPHDTMRVVFLHLPKCGGTTIHHLLAQWFGSAAMDRERFNGLYLRTASDLCRSRVFSGHYDFYSTGLIPGRTFLFTVLRDPEKRLISLYHFYRAHRLEAGPVDVELIRLAHALDIDDFLSDPRVQALPIVSNCYARFLSDIPQVRPGPDAPRASPPLQELAEQALANLTRFDHVGFTDDLDATVQVLAGRLGQEAPQELDRKQVLDDLMTGHRAMRPIEKQEPGSRGMAALRDLTRFDRIIFDRAGELFRGAARIDAAAGDRLPRSGEDDLQDGRCVTGQTAGTGVIGDDVRTG